MVPSARPFDNAVIGEFSTMSISPLGRRTFLTTPALLGLGGLWTMTSARADFAVDADLVIHESTSEAGFVHPGISLTAETIKNLREQRSEEHTSELQSRGHLVCRLLLEKKMKKNKYYNKYKYTHSKKELFIQ